MKPSLLRMNFCLRTTILNKEGLMKIITLTQKELETMKILERIKNGNLKQEEAAILLKLSSRQVRRLLKCYREEGDQGLAHKSRFKQSNRAIPEDKVAKIIELIKAKYSAFKEPAGPTFIADQLAKTDGIEIDHDTLRRLMIRNKLWEVSKRKKSKHSWRERKHHFGELVQVDGSLHIWFGDKECTLIPFIDDATGTIMAAEFFHRESTESLGKLTREYVEKHGRPFAIYSDRGSTYKTSVKMFAGQATKAGKTQYERMLSELDIKLIHAKSPQAKGRVERFFKTAQDRLVKELELANITTIEDANTFLKNAYIPEHNKKFVVLAKEKADFHRPANEFDLNRIFCLKFERRINNDYTVRFKKEWFQLTKAQKTFIRCGQRISIIQHFDRTIDMIQKGKRLAFKRIVKQDKVSSKKLTKEGNNRGKRLVYKSPSLSHPWRNPGDRPYLKNRTFLKSSR